MKVKKVKQSMLLSEELKQEMEREKTPQQDIRNNLQLKNVICCFYLNDEKNNKFMFKLYDLSNGFK